jgi:hypothetical protein
MQGSEEQSSQRTYLGVADTQIVGIRVRTITVTTFTVHAAAQTDSAATFVHCFPHNLRCAFVSFNRVEAQPFVLRTKQQYCVQHYNGLVSNREMVTFRRQPQNPYDQNATQVLNTLVRRQPAPTILLP